jgi:hypothetical protein
MNTTTCIIPFTKNVLRCGLLRVSNERPQNVALIYYSNVPHIITLSVSFFFFLSHFRA